LSFRHYTLTLGDTPLAKAVHEDEQESKTMAAKAALTALKKTQYSVVVRDLFCLKFKCILNMNLLAAAKGSKG
jgi:hypothetical protein